MNLGISFATVILLILIALGGVAGIEAYSLFGIIIPYAAFIVFLAGVTYRTVVWAKSPVPFRIPTTCGQQKSLPWIKSSFLESPHNTAGVIGRMALEVLFFRSLFRNSKLELREGKPIYGGRNGSGWPGLPSTGLFSLSSSAIFGSSSNPFRAA